MKNASQLHIPAEREPADFSIEKYSTRIFDMFSGETQEVELSCKGYTMNYLVDRFGKDFYSEKTGPDHFTARVTVDTSPTFFAWVFQFGGDITIISPASVKSEFNKMVMDQLR
jgi:predicted DNA-binding transcriptional regulator YafY